MVSYEVVSVSTKRRNVLHDITAEVEACVRRSSITSGICHVASLHTTAAVTINENADPHVARDIERTLSSLIPHGEGYTHMEGNADSHIKTTLTGVSVTVPVQQGALVCGTWQSVYFCEYDGPRSRRVAVTVIGE